MILFSYQVFAQLEITSQEAESIIEKVEWEALGVRTHFQLS